MKKGIFLHVLLSLCLLIGSVHTHANVRLPSIIGSHMVLQQKSEITLWGWSDATEKIIIQTAWDTTHYNVVGSRDANWSLKIKTPAAGGPYKITFTGRNTIVLEDVLIGEVWLCSGQSNMEWNVNGSNQPEEAIKQSANNNIRFFNIARVTSDHPQDDVQGNWVVCNPDNVKWFSAIGYFFGRKLQEELKIPVGMISSSWGGTPAEVWTPKELVENDPVLKKAAERSPSTFPGWPLSPGKTFNAMINPITNFSIAGVLWYQGESNVGNHSSYGQLLTAMIGSWRKAWNEDFPFYYVQIAPYQYGDNNVGALMREAQTKIIYPKTGMVVISDLVDNVKDIHPRNKLDVGLRLANYALGDTYGRTGVTYKSPQYKDMKIEKNKIRIVFDNAPTGLKSNGEPTDFYIAGADQNFVQATAKIDGNTVLVWNKEVKNPVAVRFGFSNTAMPNLFSKEGLPVNLFRTDSWTVDTAPAKK